MAVETETKKKKKKKKRFQNFALTPHHEVY